MKPQEQGEGGEEGKEAEGSMWGLQVFSRWSGFISTLGTTPSSQGGETSDGPGQGRVWPADFRVGPKDRRTPKGDEHDGQAALGPPRGPRMRLACRLPLGAKLPRQWGRGGRPWGEGRARSPLVSPNLRGLCKGTGLG